MTTPAATPQPFSLEQIELICRTPKEHLNRALPEGLSAQPDLHWEMGAACGSCSIAGPEVVLCTVRFNSGTDTHSYQHNLGAFANEKREQGALRLMSLVLQAAQGAALLKDQSAASMAARTVDRAIAELDATPEEPEFG